MPSFRASSRASIARSTLLLPAGITTEAGREAVRSSLSARPAPGRRLIATVSASAVLPVRLMRTLAEPPNSPAWSTIGAMATSGWAGACALVIVRSSIARPWSLEMSLVSIQRSQRVEPAAQGLAERSRLPPRPVTRPALLPSTDAAVAVATGAVQLKLPPGATQAVT